jgi:hypothetical protein
MQVKFKTNMEIDKNAHIQENAHMQENNRETLADEKLVHSVISVEDCKAADDASSQLAKELMQMSIQERDQALYDVHGVSDVTEESPELIEERLADLEKELSWIPKKKAYDKAKFLLPDYVGNRTFRLMMLRVESFNACEAAQRVVRYFEEKLELFGQDKLARDIKLADLDDDDLISIESGYMQVLPVRDRSGRAVLCCFPTLRKYKTIENLVGFRRLPSAPDGIKRNRSTHVNSVISHPRQRCVHSFMLLQLCLRMS